MDVIRPVIPKALNGHEYILVAIDYFTKWVEAALYKSVTQVVVAQSRFCLRQSCQKLNGPVLNMNN